MLKRRSGTRIAWQVDPFRRYHEDVRTNDKNKPHALGDVIAERVLDAAKDGQLYRVTVRVGRPVEFSDGPRYLCPYQIAGIGDDVVRSAAGEDSLQAIELAFKMLGADLYYLHKDFRFTWFGQSELGFPKPNI